MGRPHFSIASLLVVIGVFGIALAALRNPSYLWANVTFSVALAAIVLAIINTIYGRGANRAYWLGFVLCGGTYFAICTTPGLRDALNPRLATEVIFDLLYLYVAPQPPPPPPPPQLGMVMMMQGQMAGMGGMPAPAPPTLESRLSAWSEPDRTRGLGYPIGTVSLVSSEAFRQIGHSLATLFVAVLGGTYAQHRYKGTTRAVPPEPDR
jgi:hypothetical protein